MFIRPIERTFLWKRIQHDVPVLYLATFPIVLIVVNRRSNCFNGVVVESWQGNIPPGSASTPLTPNQQTNPVETSLEPLDMGGP